MLPPASAWSTISTATYLRICYYVPQFSSMVASLSGPACYPLLIVWCVRCHVWPVKRSPFREFFRPSLLTSSPSKRLVSRLGRIGESRRRIVGAFLYYTSLPRPRVVRVGRLYRPG